MGLKTAPTVLVFIVAIVKVSLGYIESLASNVDVTDVADKSFVPMVAFWCKSGKPPMHTEAHGWVADLNSKIDCPGSEEILQYCKTLYNNKEITNIVDVPHTNISSWPDRNGNHPRQHTVRAYRCVVGPFESDALLVPQHCEFNHEHDNGRCLGFETWHKVGEKKCTDKNMFLDGYAMLMDCKTDMFRGVEYVCCPNNLKTPKTHVIDFPKTLKPTKPELHEVVLDKEELKEDAYVAYLHGDNEFLNKKYYNEHEKFLAAEDAMKKRQHEKITLMMKEWQEAREHVNALKKTDARAADKLNKDIMQKFQKLYNGYEQADAAEKKQLVNIHLQHRQKELNSRKRDRLEKYMAELQKKNVRPHKVEKYLKGYIKAEEKDRMHTLNHFSHVRSTDPREAMRIQRETAEHLNVISERINQSLDMLHHFPNIERKVLPNIKKLLSQYKGVTNTALNVVMRPFTKAEQKKMDTQTQNDKFRNEAWVAPSQIEENKTPSKSVAENDGNNEQIPERKPKKQDKENRV
ncbi:hypothetical protein KUTeg_006425 [Tegillarca granosa]|uniref:Uncharacterized protein n=1 Tax=Tegillarca granosa TaxID=220873 RepID=A0ABQ9FID6_TEGGR|nr:hypothetical protein KUTeg_006425 [Tegillarca granosa]